MFPPAASSTLSKAVHSKFPQMGPSLLEPVECMDPAAGQSLASSPLCRSARGWRAEEGGYVVPKACHGVALPPDLRWHSPRSCRSGSPHDHGPCACDPRCSLH